DARPVEGHVRRYVDLEDGDRLAVRVDARRLLPDRPAVVVAFGVDHQRRRERRAPRARKRCRQVGVVGLQDDLPGVAEVANDHPALSSASVPASCSRWPTTSSTETTSPYFASMS